jgi:hypothetical protein
MRSKHAYKLLRVRPDGSLGSLFFARKARLPTGKWLPAQNLHQKGFAYRPGWHACPWPVAPHLKMKLATGETRAWFLVHLRQVTVHERDESQGGTWYTARQLKIIRRLEKKSD